LRYFEILALYWVCFGHNDISKNGTEPPFLAFQAMAILVNTAAGFKDINWLAG
jgi:hypothetical protein